MLRSDLRQDSTTNYTSNINSLNIEIVSLMQKDIEPYDMISLVFLLYDEPYTAMQRLTIYQRVAKDMVGNNDCNLLHDWAVHAQSNRLSWRQELVEALATCQLFNIIRKLGFHVPSVKKQFAMESSGLIHPDKKILYKLCENINAANLDKLKKTLITYGIDTKDHETCELIFLDLMCRKFITLKPQAHDLNTLSKPEMGLEKLARIIENFPDLKFFANEMRVTEGDNLATSSKPDNDLAASNLSINNKSSDEKNNQKYIKDFDDAFAMFNQLCLEEDPGKILKSDTFHREDVYEIRNPKNLGICYIINQEKFHPSKHNIENKIRRNPLEDRVGSTKDKEALKKTMSALNFEVITSDNLDHKEMIDNIKNVLINRVREEHSMFMLCILSHGTKGHVYGADSVKVKVEDIEHLFDLDEVPHLRDKPKILILQACQVEDEPYSPLVADSNKTKFQYYIKKSDVIIYWATAPDYEAYRLEMMGSIFIQFLCKAIEKYYKNEHVLDLFTKVNRNVQRICTQLQRDQLPRVEYTLLKKIYLHIPEQI